MYSTQNSQLKIPLLAFLSKPPNIMFTNNSAYTVCVSCNIGTANIPYSAKLRWCQTLANCLSFAKYNPPKFSKLCTMIHLVLVLPKFNTSKFIWRLIHPSLTPPKFSAIRYLSARVWGNIINS